MNNQWRKNIRLPAEAYRAAGSTWHVTIGVADRASRPFTDTALAESCLSAMAGRCAAKDAVLHLGCLMPDHAHLIIEIGTVGLTQLVGEVKSHTTRLWWSQGGTGPLWQRSFYDHGIRGSRDFEATVAYVLDNPVRAGLVEDWSAYPYLAGALITSSP